MARRKTGHGGARTGAGRKPRVHGALADHPVMLKFTEQEMSAFERLKPDDETMGAWMRDQMLYLWLNPCPKCLAPVLLNNRDIYGKHVCGQ